MRPADRSIALDEANLRARLLSSVAGDERVARAMDIAHKAHAGALRDEGTPYVCHRSPACAPSPEKHQYMRRETKVYLMPALSARSGIFATLAQLPGGGAGGTSHV